MRWTRTVSRATRWREMPRLRVVYYSTRWRKLRRP